MSEREIQQICLWILPLDTDIEYGRFTRIAFACARNNSCQGAGTSIDLDVGPTSVTPIPRTLGYTRVDAEVDIEQEDVQCQPA